jgi:adenine phosphoribosyltransferase
VVSRKLPLLVADDDGQRADCDVDSFPVGDTVTAWPQAWPIQLGQLTIDLPLTAMPDGSQIYAFDLMGRAIWNEAAGHLLAERIAASGIAFDVLLTAEAKAIALVQALAQHLGQDDYVVARKSLKVYMTNPIELDITSITTAQPQKFYLGQARYNLLRGRRVCVVDDVISTGGTLMAFQEMARLVGFEIVLVACVLTEDEPRQEFGGAPVLALDHIPFPGQRSEMPPTV